MGMKTWNKPQQNTTRRGVYNACDVVHVNIGSRNEGNFTGNASKITQ